MNRESSLEMRRAAGLIASLWLTMTTAVHAQTIKHVAIVNMVDTPQLV